jgi:hypothetical protein
MGSRAKHRDTHRGQPSGRNLAVSRVPSWGRRMAFGRESDVFPHADIPPIDVIFLAELDDSSNPLKSGIRSRRCVPAGP